MRKFFTLASLIIVLLIITGIRIHADEYDDITKQLNDLRQSLESSQQATHNNEVNLDALNKKLAGIRYQVSQLQQEIDQKQKEVDQGEEALVVQKGVLNQRTISYYKNLSKNSFSLLNALVADNLSQSMQQFFFQKSLIDGDRKTILQVIAYIKELQDKKASLVKENAKLLVIKKEVDSQSQFLAGEVAKSKAYESTLQSKIADLSARQQQIIAQRLGSLNIPQSAYTSASGCSDDRSVDPGFGTGFAFFTYGVPNRVGLNQYGAKGRAEAGQSYSDILHAYYNADVTTGYDQGINIHVVGSNEYGQSFDNNWNIEEYVKHIYEMPTGWNAEALKAQAIAARSYALAVTNNGANTICPSQSCQVVKQELNSQSWIDAVNATAGVVLTNGGQPIKAWFSSTHGGYVHSSADIGWNGTDWTKNAQDVNGSINNFSDLQNNAYDKSSPWFYCDWGWRAQYNKTAWLKPDEVADLVNTVLLVQRDSSTQEHLYQPDNPPPGTDTWNQDRVKNELRSRGGSPYNSVSNISVDWDPGSGKTTNVHVSGDAGDQTINAVNFHNYFNIRAPANIYIAGPLYNIEKR